MCKRNLEQGYRYKESCDHRGILFPHVMYSSYTACPLPATPRLPDNHSPLDTLIQGLELRPSSHSPLNPTQLLRQF